MKIKTLVIAQSILIISVVSAWGNGLVKTPDVEERFHQNHLLTERYFDEETIVRQQDEMELKGEIYDYGVKSPTKAFAFSLVIPGAGQYYVGSKIKAGAFLAADLLLEKTFLPRVRLCG